MSRLEELKSKYDTTRVLLLDPLSCLCSCGLSECDRYEYSVGRASISGLFQPRPQYEQSEAPYRARYHEGRV